MTIPTMPPTETDRRAAVAALACGLGLVVFAAGCGMPRTTLEASVVDRYGTPDAELDYWDELETKPVVTNHDALYGLLLLDGEEEAATWEACAAAARERGWITQDAALPKDTSATVGLIALATCDILELPGGLTMTLFGPSPRACTRELVFLEMIPPRSESQAMSGAEFMDLTGRIQDAAARTQSNRRSDEG